MSPEEWLVARRALLAKEKELTAASDALSATLRELPMTLVTKPYEFVGLNPSDHRNTLTYTLSELFDAAVYVGPGTTRGGPTSNPPVHTLMVYHFMLGPDDEAGCAGCSMVADHLSREVLRQLASKGVAVAVVSRAGIDTVEPWRKRVQEAQGGTDQGSWVFGWYSTGAEGEFNYDFHATLDEAVAPVQYNYEGKASLEAKGKTWFTSGDQSGMSVFWRDVEANDGKVYHTYSTYIRGVEKVLSTFMLLDMTPYGRQDGPGGPAAYKLSYEQVEDDKEAVAKATAKA